MSFLPWSHYPTASLIWIALAVFLLGMTKGGFPIGPVALPILVLVWPGQTDAAKSAVSFMLPLLCVMDVFAVAVYRRHIQWRLILPPAPGALLGVAAASVLFLSNNASAIGVSDRALKFLIGLIGLGFVCYRAVRRTLVERLAATPPPGLLSAGLLGFSAGVTSTLAHAAGPIAQMYLLPRRLPKMQFAATTAAFFFCLNLVKLAPFAMFGRLQKENLLLGASLLPLAPAGVAVGYLLVRSMKSRHYIAFIYIILFLASGLLIVKSLAGAG
ncbi:MAG: sulfite exporter TauE/SafE family protein [Kiritimatiellaeota bacterium]|nr:sulfite exporter TauE/SafE family protein [Kiritimatiellota bacterium]